MIDKNTCYVIYIKLLLQFIRSFKQDDIYKLLISLSEKTDEYTNLITAF